MERKICLFVILGFLVFAGVYNIAFRGDHSAWHVIWAVSLVAGGGGATVWALVKLPDAVDRWEESRRAAERRARFLNR
jgi:hypothetical protein